MRVNSLMLWINSRVHTGTVKRAVWREYGTKGQEMSCPYSNRV